MDDEVDQTLAALADPTRRAVIGLLREQPRRSGELAAALSISRPAMSRHLRVLRKARLVSEHGIAYERCGKVIIATREEELPRLETLFERGQANGVEGLEMVGPERVAEIEPHVTALKALWSPATAIAMTSI